jgi:hypothetical protein
MAAKIVKVQENTSDWNNFYDICKVTYESGKVKNFMRGNKGFPDVVERFMSETPHRLRYTEVGFVREYGQEYAV